MTTRDYDEHRLASAKVIVGVDSSAGADTALRWAADFAAARGRELQIVHGMNLIEGSTAVGTFVVMTPAVTDAVHTAAKTIMERARELVHEIAPELRVSTVLTADSAAGLLVAHSADAYAVVLGAAGSAGTVAHLGSTLLAVTAHAHGTVIVVRTDPDADDTVHTGGPVVVGIDGGPVSEAAIGVAFAEAAERRTSLVAVHVWSDWDFGQFAGRDHLHLPDVDLGEAEPAILAERLAGWQEKYPDVPVTREISRFAPAAELQRWSKSAQLVVVGNRGRGGFTGLLLGSTAHSLVQHAYCPVMVVHPRTR